MSVGYYIPVGFSIALAAKHDLLHQISCSPKLSLVFLSGSLLFVGLYCRRLVKPTADVFVTFTNQDRPKEPATNEDVDIMVDG